MKVAIISSSRADRGPLEVLETALRNKGHAVVLSTLLEEVLAKKPASRAEVTDNAATALSLIAGYVPDSDLVVTLGDRYEILGATLAAYLLNKPIAHLSGGDITEGSQDDSMRHAITKLSHLHFVTNDESRARVLQMGEEPWRVHTVGCPGIDSILGQELMNFKETKAVLSLQDNDGPFILVVYHPDTLGDPKVGLRAVERVIRLLVPAGLEIVIIGPNADPGNEEVRAVMTSFGPHVRYFDTLHRNIYLSALKNCAALIGNSSSGYYEAGVLGTHVIDVGDRQKGRIQQGNIHWTAPDTQNILFILNIILDGPKWVGPSPYGDGTAAKKIADIISEIRNPQDLLRKVWNDVRPPLGADTQGAVLGPVSVGTAGSVVTPKAWWTATGPAGFTDPGSWLWAGGRYPFPSS